MYGRTESVKFGQGDAYEFMQVLIDRGIKVPLVVTDPPYIVAKGSGGGTQGHKIALIQDELQEEGLSDSFDIPRFANLLLKVQDRVNAYIFCSRLQLPELFTEFVIKRKCKFDLLKWIKTNPVPAYSNKYLSDTEYILYVRKGGYCKPDNYDDARTVFTSPLNAKDKKEFNHPTPKPVELLRRLIRNSSKEGDIILDPFMGSGSTAVAAVKEKRGFYGCDHNLRHIATVKYRLSIVNI